MLNLKGAGVVVSTSELFSSFAECITASLAKGVRTESDFAEDSRTGATAEG